jgi:hypothetical protein
MPPGRLNILIGSSLCAVLFTLAVGRTEITPDYAGSSW